MLSVIDLFNQNLITEFRKRFVPEIDTQAIAEKGFTTIQNSRIYTLIEASRLNALSQTIEELTEPEEITWAQDQFVKLSKNQLSELPRKKELFELVSKDLSKNGVSGFRTRKSRYYFAFE